MNVSLGSHWDGYVAAKINGGKFQSASEVVRAALRLLEEQDEERRARLENLRMKVGEGLRAANEGKSAPFDDDVVERIKRKGRKKLHDKK